MWLLPTILCASFYFLDCRWAAEIVCTCAINKKILKSFCVGCARGKPALRRTHHSASFCQQHFHSTLDQSSKCENHVKDEEKRVDKNGMISLKTFVVTISMDGIHSWFALRSITPFIQWTHALKYLTAFVSMIELMKRYIRTYYFSTYFCRSIRIRDLRLRT